MGPLATTIWIICYFAVLLGLAGYGIHRYTMIFLYWRNRRKKPEPQSEFKDLPSVTVQLPIFNELHVVERLISAVSNLDYPKDRLQIQILHEISSPDLASPESGIQVPKCGKLCFSMMFLNMMSRLRRSSEIVTSRRRLT